MNEIEFGWIGWCKEKEHDKVWTYFKVSDTWYAGWGRRGKKLSFKKHGADDYGDAPKPLRKLKDSKENKGYKEVDSFMLFTVFPYFKDDVNKELLVKALTGKIM